VSQLHYLTDHNHHTHYPIAIKSSSCSRSYLWYIRSQENVSISCTTSDDATNI